MNPDLWAIIPVKPFATGKSRLAGILDAQARHLLNKKLFDHVFGVALAALGPDRVTVVTADVELSASVDQRGSHGIADAGDLNAALGQACRTVIARGAQAVMILPSDLPILTPADLTALRSALAAPPSAVIAPDRADQATNALLLSPADPNFFRFGPGSFDAHSKAARERGVAIEIVRRQGLAFDLDTPEDYRAYLNSTAERALP